MRSGAAVWLDGGASSPAHLIEGDRFVSARHPLPEAHRLNCEGAQILPGRVNCHTHLYSALVPLGMPPPKQSPQSFLQILERVWWRLDRALDRDSLRAAARLYVAEALLSGTTTLIDHHESPSFIEGSLDVIADACEELGARALVCYGATERNAGREEARRGLLENRRFLTTNRRARVRGMVGLHASFTVSDATIREAGELGREFGAALHVHVAEDLSDVEDAFRRGYPGPFARLAQLGAIGKGSILAHAVHLDEEAVQQAEEEECWIVQNPRSNQNNGVGYPRALSHSRKVALGTDGFPSDLFAEESALSRLGAAHGEKEEQLDLRRRNGVLLASELWSLPLGDRDGGVADVAVVTPSNSAGTVVRHVIVDGRVVVEDGRLVTGDVESIREEARAQAQELWRRMERL